MTDLIGSKPDMPHHATAGGDKRSPLHLLPPEVRNQIYRYLLSTKLTIIPALPDYDPLHIGIKIQNNTELWPRNSHRLHPNILRVDRQINSEATAILYDDNVFIAICSATIDLKSHNENVGFITLREKSQANNYQYCAIFIRLEHSAKLGESSTITSAWKNIPAKHSCVIAYEDLHRLCQALLVADCDRSLSEALMDTSIEVVIKRNAVGLLNRTSLPSTAQQLLIDQFAELHSVRYFDIQGLLPGTNEVSQLVERVTRPPPKYKDVLKDIKKLTVSGDNYFRANDFPLAVTTYIHAMRIHYTLLSYHRAAVEAPHLLPRLQISLHRLNSNLSAAHLKLHQWRDSLYWTQQALICDKRYIDLIPNDMEAVRKCLTMIYRLVLAYWQAGAREHAIGRIHEFISRRPAGLVIEGPVGGELDVLSYYIAGDLREKIQEDVKELLAKEMERAEERANLDDVLKVVSLFTEKED